MFVDLILGTAGHIDHGKTSLIKALTGVDTDRLPEEKKRGITIELGFAELLLPAAIHDPQVADVRFGIVDVPGHERFVRNMLAGATGIDVALLVVAANDSVKPQTIEHLEILRMLDLTAGVIALTKCDMAEADWIDLVEAEVRETVADSFLADAPLVRTSAHTGQGIDALREQLAHCASRVWQAQAADRLAGPFRMAVDRAFTIAGHGAVVTGSVVRGGTKLGDELLLEPGGHSVRVRGLQNHDRDVAEVHRGQRAAINIAGVHHDQIGRGHELSSPGHLKSTTLISATIHLLDHARKPLKNRATVRIHIGAKECMATVTLPEGAALEPGVSSAAQLFLDEPIVAVWGQPLVVRSESPVATIGGGRVIDPNAERIRRGDLDTWRRLESLADADPLRRAEAACYFLGVRPWQPDDLARAAGIASPTEVYRQLVTDGVVEEIVVSQTRTWRLHRDQAEAIRARIERVMESLHEKNPLMLAFEVSRVQSRFDYLQDSALFSALLDDLVQSKRVRRVGAGVALAGHGPQLSKNEVKLFDEILEMFQAAGVETPTPKEIEKQVPKNKDSVGKLIDLAAAQGELIKVSGDYFLHKQVEEELRSQLRALLADGGQKTTSELREALGTTRKYAIPLFEYFDRVGLTKRTGDARGLRTDST